MKTIGLLTLALALSLPMMAQSAIPAGTLIPARLDTSINARKAKQGEMITAKVAQNVQLNNGEQIKAGSRLTGEVLGVAPEGSQISLRFDKIEINGQMTPIRTDLRAIASPLEVEQAQTQISGDDRGSVPAWSQTTTLIGGDVAYREAGTVDDGDQVVGKTVYAGDWGAVSKPAAYPGDPCRGSVAGNDNPQAMWVFSHDACGVYGYEAKIAKAGRSDPQGRIDLASTYGDLKLRSGSALLLRVNGSGEQVAADESATK